MMLEAQLRDAERSRRWTLRLVEQALEVEGNRSVLEGWVKKWTPLGEKAIDAFCAALPGLPTAAQDARDGLKAFQKSLGLA